MYGKDFVGTYELNSSNNFSINIDNIEKLEVADFIVDNIWWSTTKIGQYQQIDRCHSDMKNDIKFNLCCSL
jgi:dephospho-CoA kinase